MINYGVSDKGFRAKRLTEVQEGMRDRAASIFADLVPPGEVVDTSASSLLGRLITLASVGNADLWELAQQVYLAFDPNSAVGVALDNLVAYSGISRMGDVQSEVVAIFTGDVDTVILEGSVVRASGNSSDWQVSSEVQLLPSGAVSAGVGVISVDDNTTYSISYAVGSDVQTASYLSGAGATQSSILSGLADAINNSHPLMEANVANNLVTVSFKDVFREADFTTSSNLQVVKISKRGMLQSVEAGAITGEPDTITAIQTPVLGWDRVTNPIAASVGRLRETDEELRVRFRDSKFRRAANISEALYANLISLAGVDEVRVYENDSEEVDQIGLPPHSFMPIVLGGVDAEIARSVWNNKPLGISSEGNTTVTILDSQGFPQDISFERPTPLPVYITIDITVVQEFPDDGEEQIKDALIAYINTLNIGEDVVYSRLYTPINSVRGHQVDSLLIGTASPPNMASNIIVPFNRITSLSRDSIVINKGV